MTVPISSNRVLFATIAFSATEQLLHFLPSVAVANTAAFADERTFKERPRWG